MANKLQQENWELQTRELEGEYAKVTQRIAALEAEQSGLDISNPTMAVKRIREIQTELASSREAEKVYSRSLAATIEKRDTARETLRVATVEAKLVEVRKRETASGRRVADLVLKLSVALQEAAEIEREVREAGGDSNTTISTALYQTVPAQVDHWRENFPELIGLPPLPSRAAQQARIRADEFSAFEERMKDQLILLALKKKSSDYAFHDAYDRRIEAIQDSLRVERARVQG